METTKSSETSSDNRRKILIGVTGSVASLKLPILVDKLKEKYNIQVVATQHAMHFFEKDKVDAKIFTDEDEWTWKNRSDPVLHIELRKWADLFVIAPLDANTLAKISNGLCDNLLTCVARAWDFSSKPILVAPAMNTMMWDHPITMPQINILKSWHVKVVGPISKNLICGDKGLGAMAEVPDIVQSVEEILGESSLS